MKLKTKLSKLRHEGHITDAEYAVINNVLNKFSTQPPKTKPCEDCISREEAIKEFQIYREYSSNRSNAGWVDRIEAVLMHLPSVTPQQKTGKWIRWYEQKENDGCIEYIPHCKCSECGKEYDPHSSQFVKCCPNCGARMIEPQESESDD